MTMKPARERGGTVESMVWDLRTFQIRAARPRVVQEAIERDLGKGGYPGIPLIIQYVLLAGLIALFRH